jgi:hypothetical protein
MAQIRILESTPERDPLFIFGGTAGTSAKVFFDGDGFSQIKLIVEIRIE